MAKFTDAVRNTLSGYFNAGDQPTEVQFTALILAIQEGIEEHDHAGTGDGDGVSNLIGPVGIGVAAGAYRLILGGDATVVLQLKSTSDIGVSAIYFADPSAAAPGRIEYHHNGNYLSFHTLGGAERVRVDEDGYVGINVTPLGQLHIDQDEVGGAIPVLILDQADVSEGTINFIASERGVIGEGTNSVQSVRVELNGVVYRLAIYANA